MTTTPAPKLGACSLCLGTGRDPEDLTLVCPGCEGRPSFHTDCVPLTNEDAWDALGALCPDPERLCVCCGDYVPLPK
jgi:hypothetical protein